MTNARTLAFAAAFLAAGAAQASATAITWDELKASKASAEKNVELVGFMLPVDYEGDKVFQFMLMPYAGACSHMPPPPPNQVVLVTPAEPVQISRVYELVAVSGHLKQAHDLSQLYILDGVSWVESDYRIGKADVRTGTTPASSEPMATNPWKFMKK